MSSSVSGSLLLRVAIPLVAILLALGAGFGVLHMRSASPVVDRSALQLATVESGPMICRVEGLGTLVPEDVRWLAAGTEGRVRSRAQALVSVMPGFRPGIHDLLVKKERRGWPGQARP